MPKVLDFNLKGKSLKGVEIFAAGTWNGDTYTVEDLDQMVEAFQKTQESLIPYAKLGHDDEQALLQKDGYPAAGWVTSLKRVGTKLIADFRDVPQKIYDLIVGGAYRKVSSEIFLNIKIGEKLYPKLLKAVAFLGADTPAVDSLDDIISLYSLGAVKSYDTDAKAVSHKFELNVSASTKEDEEMDIKELQAKLDAANAEIATLKGQVAELAKQSETDKKAMEDCQDKGKQMMSRNEDLVKQNTELTKQVGEFSRKANEAKVADAVAKLIENKHIVPAQKDHVTALLTQALSSERKFTIEGKETNEFDSLVATFSKATADVHTDEKSQVGVGGMDLDKQVQAYIQKAKAEGRTVSYKEALLAVSDGKGLEPAKPL